MLCSQSSTMGVSTMANLRNLQLNLEVGQTICIGKESRRAKITKIEYFRNTGDIVIGTDHGSRKALTFRIMESATPQSGNSADKYR
jgi:hypothetical protein